MKHYKIIHRKTGETMCYAKCNLDDPNAIAVTIPSMFGEECGLEEVSKEEYERETEDTDDESEVK